IKFSPKIMDELVSMFFSKASIEEMIKDSFYGHNNIDLKEIENRMRITEKNIGNAQTLLDFIKSAVDLYKGELKPSKENSDIYEVSLPEEIQNDISFEFDEKYLITPNKEISVVRHDIDGVSLKSRLVSGLIEKVKNEAFAEDNSFYGRTAAFASAQVFKVSVICNLKLRYVVNTNPKSIMEEIAVLGLDLFSEERLGEELINEIYLSNMKNHGRSEILLKKHLKKALELPGLNKYFDDIGNERLERLVKERKQTKARLSEQGLTSDLEGIEDIEIVGIDLLTVTLVYPIGAGE
ncbi:MAG: hypothetical protein ACTSWY_08720, partial [Promethearchaeota archaeon]